MSGPANREVRFWRGLDANAQPDFEAAAEAEFPAAFEGVEGPARRQVLKAMAASMGLAGLAACSDQPDEQALPYVHAPEFTVPSRARRYATAVTPVGGYAQPVMGTTYAGRPTKLEGLPSHPANQGGADAYTQAALLGLYDPDRSQTPRLHGRPADWSVLDAALVRNAAVLDAQGGTGFRLLTARTTSPTFARQLDALMQRWPQARWHVLEPLDAPARVEAVRQVFGRRLDLLPRLDLAEVVVSFGDDLLGPGPAQARNGRLWSLRRRAFQRGEGRARLFVAEPTPSLTGAMAERRLATAHRRISVLVQALAAGLGSGVAPAGLTPAETAWITGAAKALAAAGTKGLIVVGPAQPAEAQALGLALNGKLGAVGSTLRLIEPVAPAPPDGEVSYAALVRDMAAGQVDTLVVLDANPVYAGPADLDFAGALKRVRFSLHGGLHADETAALCTWHAPLQHELETWSDARAIDGTVSIVQPLVRPFYAVRSRHALIEALQGRLSVDPREIVAETWRAGFGGDFDARWDAALRQGFVDGSGPAEVTAQPAAVAPTPAPAAPDDALELVFRPDPSAWDGRFANNPWLQELPKPANAVTWDNVLAVSPALAREQGLNNGDVVEVAAGGRRMQAAVWVTPGQARRTLTAHLGYGRRTPGQLGDGRGYDAYAIRTTAAPWAVQGVGLTRTGKRTRLACTQPFQAMEGEDFVRTVAPAAARQPAKPRPAASLYAKKPEGHPAWGMSIDTDLCIGCNACVTACDAENNIAMVGKHQVAQGRMMHWLRVDHYFRGEAEAPTEAFQPVPCMHCEQAPCEIGCPVHAAVHSPDGLNLQVYNRCIGTRTCSSYCPYKVRRFNWFELTRNDPPERQAQRNPNVTVRSRGVMEKCTYCIQRISEARIRADLEQRPIRDGEVVTACQQTCPTQAIVFGDISDPGSAVSRRKATARDYAMAEEANTRPRTTYLARIDGEGDA